MAKTTRARQFPQLHMILFWMLALSALLPGMISAAGLQPMGGGPTTPNQIFIMDADGSNRTQVTTEGGVNFNNPSWSPDGTQIAYQKYTAGYMDVLVSDADGSNIRTISNGAYDPTWSADGTKLAFHANNQIYVKPVDLSAPRAILISSGQMDYMPDFSPRGHVIGFTKVYTESNLMQVWAANADGSHPYQVTDEYNIGLTRQSDPTWAPSNLPYDAIAYTKWQNNGNATIWVQRFDGSGEYPLTTEADGHVSMPSWGPNGIAYQRANVGGGYDIYVMDHDGANKRRIGSGESPDWSPDGSKIVFADVVRPVGTPDPFLSVSITNPHAQEIITDPLDTRFEVQIDSNQTATIAVTLKKDDGTGIAGMSFTTTGSTSLCVWNFSGAHEADGSCMFMPFFIWGDLEENERYELSVKATSGALTSNASQFFWVNDDPRSVLTFDPVEQVVAEEDGQVTITLNRDAASAGTAVTFKLLATGIGLQDGSAILPVGLKPGMNVVTFPVGQTSISWSVSLPDNTLADGDSGFIFVLQSNPDVIITGLGRASVTIDDTDISYSALLPLVIGQ